MPVVKVPCLSIDRNSVLDVKEKLLELDVDDENLAVIENDENDETLEENYVDSLTNGGESSFAEIAFILGGIGMEKYLPIFKQENISLDTFLNLTEADLEELGISNVKDRKFMVKNIQEHKQPTDFVVAENHTEDFQIAKNVQNHLVLIQNYCTYVEWQMKKNQLQDHKVTPDKTALDFYKAFTKAAITQSEIISKLVFDKNTSDHLIAMLLKVNNLVLPKELEDKLYCRKVKKKKNFARVMAVVGLSSMLVLITKMLLKKINYLN